MSSKLNIIILAAGKGTRMHSHKLKVLHPLATSTVIEQVLNVSKKLAPDKIIMVYGHQGEQLQTHLAAEKLTWVEQKNPQGTGHAVQLAMAYVDKNAKVLVLVGDAPLINTHDLKKLLKYKQAVITAIVDNPYGYGRIIKNGQGLVTAIVEEKDANDVQRQICEINSGIIMANATDLQGWLDNITNNNQQKELYLTDVLTLAHAAGKSFNTLQVTNPQTIQGINNRVQLAECEAIKQQQIRQELMLAGVYLPVPESVQIRGNLKCGKDVTIDAGVILQGNNHIADEVIIGAYSIINNCQLGKATRIAPHSILEGVVTAGDCDIGPFARLRAGTKIGKQAKIGNFVETKKTTIGVNSKASHLTYLGDCDIGNNVNIGAGTITCNYDGVNKFKTIIEDNVFIGSDTQLIAPVRVGQGATIGAGTTLTKDAPMQKLTLSRTKQKTIDGWQKPQKNN
ncbi:MAG: bifunctional UDP-N-acetylglucosamine diphosphorylase/glucosamine-1-phosphate N-acetyltransferase GlmU [Proteobacteria bacterium]|nr:bifunctional UDP-N-acetylglucosamine diphosphorylase/glucosamine-1-phosphate N-acetyltransferase GlmU [Pseudomonadota bacterium]